MSTARGQSLNQQIKDFLLSKVLSGEWTEGDRIPSEAELCAMFSTSRMTANRAVRELTEQGYLRRTQGAGTFVAKATVNATMLEVRSIRAEIEANGGVHRARVLRQEAVTLDDATAAELNMPVGTSMFLVEAIHANVERPIQLERRHVAPDFAPGFLDTDFTDKSVSDYLLRTVSYNEAEHRVSAIAADARLSEYLHIAEGSPCLRLVRRTLLGGDLVTHAEFIHPGTDFTLSGRIPVPVQLARRP